MTEKSLKQTNKKYYFDLRSKDPRSPALGGGSEVNQSGVKLSVTQSALLLHQQPREEKQYRVNAVCSSFLYDKMYSGAKRAVGRLVHL